VGSVYNIDALVDDNLCALKFFHSIFVPGALTSDVELGVRNFSCSRGRGGIVGGCGDEEFLLQLCICILCYILTYSSI
jgi:hypothetical protein